MTTLQHITLPGTEITTTPIGFGCSSLLGDRTPREGLRLLETAFDAGIGHFDVARYYGYGDAEDMVGSLVKGRRDRMTITSKFGLQPIRQVAQSKVVLRSVRRLMRYSPYLRDLVRRGAVINKLVQKSRFDVGSVQQSLETSLRKLRTDYLDVFLLHECDPGDCQSPELLNFLVQARAEGKIRSFGVGAPFASVEIICRDAPAFSQVTQFESTVTVPRIRLIPRLDSRLPSSSRARITFGAFLSVRWLRDRLHMDAVFASKCSEALDMDCTAPHAPARMIMQAAIQDNREGIILFRTSRPENIINNVHAATQAPLSQEQTDIFLRLVSEQAAKQAD